MSSTSMSSSSVDDLHPGFKPINNLSPVTPPSPYTTFVRKRSFPLGGFVRAEQHTGTMAEETKPLSPRGDDEEGGGYAAHSSRPLQPVNPPPSHMPSRSQGQAHSHVSPIPGLVRQISNFTLSSRKTRGPTLPSDPTSQHVKTMDNLSFFQKNFTKPVDKDPEKTFDSHNRSFAFFSRGFLLAIIVMLFLLLGVVAAAVAVTLDHHKHLRAPTASPPPHAPVRLAIFDNFPDPTLWYNDGTYYAFATNNGAGILQQPRNASSYEYGTSNIQIATSTNFVNWTLQGSKHDPLPTIGAWVTHGMTGGNVSVPKANVWAPGVIQRPTDKKFVMYYSANRAAEHNDTENHADTAPGRHPPPHCIGAAVSETNSPAGPYKPLADPLACPIDQGGAIDPAAFQDEDGTLYVVYKVDGNNIGHGGLCGNTKAPIVPTPIQLQMMLPDGITRNGDPLTIMNRTKADGPLVEAPSLMRSHEGIYFLFFSSGCTRSPTYDVKYATALNITGPYIRAEYPLLQTGDFGLLAPGSVGVHDDGNGGFNMAFHARVQAPQGRIRAMFTTKLVFNGHTVRMNSTLSST